MSKGNITPLIIWLMLLSSFVVAQEPIRAGEIPEDYEGRFEGGPLKWQGMQIQGTGLVNPDGTLTIEEGTINGVSIRGAENIQSRPPGFSGVAGAETMIADIRIRPPGTRFTYPPQHHDRGVHTHGPARITTGGREAALSGEADITPDGKIFTDGQVQTEIGRRTINLRPQGEAEVRLSPERVEAFGQMLASLAGGTAVSDITGKLYEGSMSINPESIAFDGIFEGNIEKEGFNADLEVGHHSGHDTAHLQAHAGTLQIAEEGNVLTFDEASHTNVYANALPQADILTRGNDFFSIGPATNRRGHDHGTMQNANLKARFYSEGELADLGALEYDPASGAKWVTGTQGSAFANTVHLGGAAHGHAIAPAPTNPRIAILPFGEFGEEPRAGLTLNMDREKADFFVTFSREISMEELPHERAILPHIPGSDVRLFSATQLEGSSTLYLGARTNFETIKNLEKANLLLGWGRDDKELLFDLGKDDYSVEVMQQFRDGRFSVVYGGGYQRGELGHANHHGEEEAGEEEHHLMLPSLEEHHEVLAEHGAESIVKDCGVYVFCSIRW